MPITPFRRLPGMIIDQKLVSQYRRRIIEGELVPPSREPDSNGSVVAEELAPAEPQAPARPTLGEPVYRDRGIELGELIKQRRRVRLASSAGDEATSLLLSICRRWATNQLDLGYTRPLYIQLPHFIRTPEQAICDSLSKAGFPHDTLATRRGLASGQWLLLLDSWHQLALPLRDQWRQWLVQTLPHYPALSAVIVTGPDDHKPWPGLETFDLG